MKVLLWIMSALAVAVGLVALAGRTSAGYVQIVWPPHRIELSLVMVIVLLVAAFALMYLGLRLVSAMVGVPQKVREYRQTRRKRRGLEALTGALHDFFAGRFARAEKAAMHAVALGEQPGLAAMLAARAAHELREPERRDQHLAQGAEHLPENDLMKVITEADMLLDQRRAADALSVLNALPQKNTAGLRLQLKALQLTNAWEQSLPVIDQLEKRKVFDAVQARDLRARAWAEHLAHCATETAVLDEAWRKVPRALRTDVRVVRAAAQAYIGSGAAERGAELIERCLDHTWDSGLTAVYAECAGADTVRQIERAERWLAAQPHDAVLLLALARLCMRQALWGKAQSYLDASIAVEATHEAHLALAQLHEQLGAAEVAQRHQRSALDLALLRLRERGAK